MHAATLLAALAAMGSVPTAMASLYPRGSNVIQVDGKNYEKLLGKSNHTSILEFYAPWCGHCKNLQPIYEKAASHLHSLVPVAAINCDEPSNKPFCGSMGIQGFPTLKIIKPGKNGKKPRIEDYRGERSTAAISDAVTSLMPNYVKRVTDKEFDEFKSAEGPKVLLFTEKTGTSTLMKSLSIDYLGKATVGQLRAHKDQMETAKELGIKKFPTLVFLEDDDVKIYDGNLKKPEIMTWLREFVEPNPDASKWDKVGPIKSKTDKADKPKKSSKEAEKTPEVKEEPAQVVFSSVQDVDKTCLGTSSKTCIVIFNNGPVETVNAGTQLAVDFTAKSYKGPWITQIVGGKDEAIVKAALGVSTEASLAIVNNKRNWVVVHDGDVTATSLPSLIEAAKDGSAKRQKIGGVPEDVKEETHDEL